MKTRTRPLAVAVAALSVLGAVGGCDSNEGGADDDAGNPGAVVSGGTGGVGGGGAMGGTAGTKSSDNHGGGTALAGRAGRGGGAGRASTSNGTLGSRCASDGSCESGLTCVTDTSRLLDGKSPAGGICTLPCQSDTECRAVAAGSFCVAFDAERTLAYCLEGCRTGVAGEPKCHGRTDVACTLLGLVPTSTACGTSDDCAISELCATTADPPVCGDIVTGCVPNCGGDFDCAPGSFCEFSTGLCVQTLPSGLSIGDRCDPTATTDPCNGYCQSKDDAGTEGVCAAFCTLAPGLLGCGWDGSEPADAACLFLTRLSPEPGIGDVGICGALCDCNADCVATDDRCVDESNGDILTLWGRTGYCRQLQTGESEANTFERCP
jgi:hypothetical protein